MKNCAPSTMASNRNSFPSSNNRVILPKYIYIYKYWYRIVSDLPRGINVSLDDRVRATTILLLQSNCQVYIQHFHPRDICTVIFVTLSILREFFFLFNRFFFFFSSQLERLQFNVQRDSFMIYPVGIIFSLLFHLLYLLYIDMIKIFG